MTATVRQFCREYGINEKSDNLVENIYEALTGGGKYKEPCGLEREREEVETPISDGN